MTEHKKESELFDVVVLGSGEAGKYIAWTLAKQGKTSVVIERKWIGGSCPNIACLPSKNVIHSAKVASYFFRSDEFGIHKNGTCIDMAAVRDRKRKMVAGLVEMHLGNFRASGAQLIMGNGKFVAPKTIEVSLADGGTRIVQGENVVISTGSRALVEATPGLREASPLTHLEALELDHNVWAVGDCAGSPHFTHIAFDDFRVVKDNLMGVPKVTTGRQVPSCVFTDPELARIGLDETAAKRQGIDYRLAKIPMISVLRSRTLSETRGFLKVLIAKESDKILGFTAFGVGAGEVMATVQIAMMAGLPYTALREAVFTHPTLTEGLIPLFSAVPKG